MPRLRLNFIKCPILAILSLIGVVSTLEVSLTISDIYRPVCESRNGPCPLGFQHSQLLETSWTSHHRLKPLQKITSAVPGGGALTLRTNSFGLRGDDVAIPKPVALYRVLCLGDETVLAAEVDEDQTFCARLQSMLQAEDTLKVEVLNGGVPGDCPLISSLRYQHQLMALEPDLVVIHFDMSDVSDDHGLRPFTVRRDQSPVACAHPNLLSPKKNPLCGWERFKTVQLAREMAADWTEDEAPRDDTEDIDSRQGRYAWLRDKSPDWSLYIEQALQPLADLQELLARKGGRLLVVTSPAPWQVSPLASSGRGVRETAGVPPNAYYRSRRPFEVVAAWCVDHQIAFVDASAPMQSTESPERLYLKHAPRFSALGHEMFAREVAQGIFRLLAPSPPVAPWPSDREPPPRQAGNPLPRRI